MSLLLKETDYISFDSDTFDIFYYCGKMHS